MPSTGIVRFGAVMPHSRDVHVNAVPLGLFSVDASGLLSCYMHGRCSYLLSMPTTIDSPLNNFSMLSNGNHHLAAMDKDNFLINKIIRF